MPHLHAAGKQHGVDVAVGKLRSVELHYLAAYHVEAEALAAYEVGGKLHLHVLTAVAATLAVGQCLLAVHRRHRLVAATHERGYRLLAILTGVFRIHQLCRRFLVHAVVRQQAGEGHEIVVAVAVGKLSPTRPVHHALCHGKHPLRRPPRGPLVLCHRLGVDDAASLPAFLHVAAHVHLQRLQVGVEPCFRVVAE